MARDSPYSRPDVGVVGDALHVSGRRCGGDNSRNVRTVIHRGPVQFRRRPPEAVIGRKFRHFAVKGGVIGVDGRVDDAHGNSLARVALRPGSRKVDDLIRMQGIFSGAGICREHARQGQQAAEQRCPQFTVRGGVFA